MDETLILWDVIEEHLDEAEFLFEMWEHAVVAPNYTRHDVERSFGERLRAHLDAIVIAGESASRRLLAPGLEDEESERNRAAACALALLEMPGEEHAWRTFQALVNAPAGSGLRAGVARALEVSGRRGLDEELRAAVTHGGGEQVAELWAALSERRVDPGASVAEAIRAGDVALRTAAVRAAVVRPPEGLWGLVEPLLEASEESVRVAAIETAMAWGARAGWARCVEEARRGQAEALWWVGMLGGEEEVELLREVARRPEMRHAALRALGYSGRKAAAEECLKWMSDQDEKTAKLAAEAFGTITGVDAYRDGFGAEGDDDLTEPEEEEVAAGVEAEETLPVPDPTAFVRWWEEHGGHLKVGARFLASRLWQGDVVFAQWSEGVMRRARALEREVLARSFGTVTLPPRTLGSRRAPGVEESLLRVDFQRRPHWR